MLTELKRYNLTATMVASPLGSRVFLADAPNAERHFVVARPSATTAAVAVHRRPSKGFRRHLRRREK